MKVAVLVMVLLIATTLESRAAAERVFKFATLSPLTGDSAALGLQIQYGAELALQQRAAQFAQRGVEIRLNSIDDEGNPTRGEQAARAILADPTILGVVGAYNSSVSLAAARTFESVKLAMITPGSTADELTTPIWTHVNRVCASTADHSSVGTAFLTQDLGAKSVLVITDNTTYGNGLSKQVQSDLKKQGVRIAGFLGVSDENGIAAAVAQVRASAPDAVYFAGLAKLPGLFVKALRADGQSSVFMGAGGLDSPDFIKYAGTAGQNTYFSTSFGPIGVYPRATVPFGEFQKTFGVAPSGLTVLSYDAMNVLLDALSRTLLTRAGPSRKAVQDEVRKTRSSRGVSGPLAFTDIGERRDKPVFIMQYQGEGGVPRAVRSLRVKVP